MSELELFGVKCKRCSGNVYLKPIAACPECGAEEFMDEKLSGRGTVYTFTICRVGPTGFEDKVPYVYAIVELEEGPWVETDILDCTPEEVDIGTPVVLAGFNASQRPLFKLA